MASPKTNELSEDLVKEAHLELVRRSLAGAMAYSMLLLVIVLFTPYSLEHSALLIGAIISLAVIGVCRVTLARRILRKNTCELDDWRRFRIGVIASAIVWSGFSTLTLVHYQEQWTGMIGLLMTAGIAAGGMTSLAPDLSLARLYLLLLLVPSIVATGAHGGPEGRAAAMTIAIYLIFLFIESQHQNTGYWQASRDRAALRTKAKELEEARKLADEATAAKSDFLAKMSHEIRTPMNAVIGMTDLLLDSEIDGQRERFVRTIRQSSESLLKLVNDILDLSKIEAGKLELDPVDFNLREIVHDVLRVLALRAHSKGLEVSCRVLPNIPDTLTGDAGRLRQVLINLVGNAIKFTSEGSVVVQIELMEQRSQETVLHFSVKDTGIGILEEQQLKIFEAFTQADNSTTRHYGGTGLGLSISKALVEMMKGEIWCETQAGQGSTFHFTACFDIRQSDVGRLPSAELGNISNLRVLIVDDTPGNDRILAEMFESWGMSATICSDTADAIKKLETPAAKFDFIIADAQLGDEDGFAFAEDAIKRLRLPPPIMMLTSDRQKKDALRCRELGIPIYVLKPVSESEMFDAIMTTHSSRKQVEPSSEAAQPLQFSAAPTGVRILLVEDNPVNQEVAQHMLAQKGHDVTIACNGREAVKYITESSRFDMILMDIQMPEMDGLQATAAIRKLEEKTGAHIPIVAMTAHAMKGDRERCLQAGMDGYIAKPIQSRVLYETVEAFAPVPASSSPPVSNSQSPSSSRLAPATAPQESVKFVDSEAIIERLGGDVGAVKTIVQLFMEDCPVQMTAIQEAIKAGDSKALTASAHSLKGSLLLLSSDAAANTAKELEMMGSGVDASKADQLFETLEFQVSKLSAELRQLIENLR